MRIGYAGQWLAAQDAAAWDEVDEQRRALAALAWHPRFGDRGQDLVVLCHGADPDEIDAALRSALLTDAELAAGGQAWAALPDPFGWAHDDPCGLPSRAGPDADDAAADDRARTDPPPDAGRGDRAARAGPYPGRLRAARVRNPYPDRPRRGGRPGREDDVAARCRGGPLRPSLGPC